jgi:hypothetical protein
MPKAWEVRVFAVGAPSPASLTLGTLSRNAGEGLSGFAEVFRYCAAALAASPSGSMPSARL